MYTLTLVQIESNNKNSKIKELSGYAPGMPVEGKSFFMYINGNGSDARHLYTTEVQSIEEKTDGLLIRTNNSVYLLKDIQEVISENC